MARETSLDEEIAPSVAVGGIAWQSKSRLIELLIAKLGKFAVQTRRTQKGAETVTLPDRGGTRSFQLSRERRNIIHQYPRRVINIYTQFLVNLSHIYTKSRETRDEWLKVSKRGDEAQS